MEIKKFIASLVIISLVMGVFMYKNESAQASLYFLNEFIIEPLVRKIANALENKLINKISNFVAGTDSKTPRFIVSWRNHMLDSQARGNDVFRAVLADTKLCPHFQEGINQSFGAENYTGAIQGAIVKNRSGRVVYQNKTSVPGLPPFQVSARCTLPSSFDVSAYREDFRNGGWAAWGKLVEPQNNFFGVFVMTLQEQQRQIAIDEQSARDQSIAGQGFLAQSLGLGGTDANGPAGCVDTIKDLGPFQEVIKKGRCTFQGKIVTPNKIFSDTAVNALDKKLGRVGGATKLTDVILRLVDAVTTALTNKLFSLGGQKSYEEDFGSDASGSFDTSDEPKTDPIIGGQSACFNDCTQVKENTCTQKAKTIEEIIDQPAFDACMNEARNTCLTQCSNPFSQ